MKVLSCNRNHNNNIKSNALRSTKRKGISFHIFFYDFIWTLANFFLEMKLAFSGMLCRKLSYLETDSTGNFLTVLTTFVEHFVQNWRLQAMSKNLNHRMIFAYKSAFKQKQSYEKPTNLHDVEKKISKCLQVCKSLEVSELSKYKNF